MPFKYCVAEPNSYLIITGAGIENLRIEKKALVWPLQKVSRISMMPFDFSMTLQAMTMEKLQFKLPAVFTIGPLDENDAIIKYATLLTGGSQGTEHAPRGSAVGTGRNHVQEIVKGIIEGETRSIVSNMSMEELFKERTIFRDKVIKNVQSELDQFGLRIYNANVKELQDTDDSQYFASLSRKAHEGALNQARIDTAEARARGEIGEAEKQGRSKQEIAKINAATAVLETERKGEKATADAALKTKEINIERELELERINAKRVAEARDAQMQKDVEIKRADMELERLRATTVTEAKIQRESAEQKAQADLYSQQKAADGVKYSAQADADASYAKQERETNAMVYRQTQEATAHLERRKKEADATFFGMKAEADGIREMAAAYGELAHVLGGPSGLMQYLMLKDNMYEKLALANAKAINGLNPKINVWNTGSGGETSDPAATMRNLFQNLPPLLSTINDQTGIQPPSWLMNMPKGESQADRDAVAKKTKGIVNGT